MPSIQVRDVPEHLYQALSEEAKREHRSLTQQVLVTLERGMQRIDHLARRKALLEEIRREGPIGSKFDPVALIREDRNR